MVVEYENTTRDPRASFRNGSWSGRRECPRSRDDLNVANLHAVLSFTNNIKCQD
jgi:hypothetical protein